MAISFVAAGSSVASFGSPVSVTLPGGIQDGDLILICIQDGTGTTGDVSAPSATGYQLLANCFTHDPLDTQRCPILWKIASGTESNPSVSMTPVNAGWSARAVVYRGVDTTHPIDTVASPEYQTATTVTPKTLTTRTNGAMVLAICGFGANSSPSLQVGSEQGFTARVTSAIATGDNGYVLADRLVASAGDVTPPSFSQGVSANMVCQMLALRESGASYSSVNPVAVDGVFGAITPATKAFPLPTHASGDLILLLCYHANSAAQTFSAPGFTVQADESNNGTLALLSKVADGTETTVTVTASTGSGGWSATPVIVENNDETTPWDVAAVTSTGASSTTFTPTGITPTSDDTMVISAVSGRNATGKNLNTAQGFTGLVFGRALATVIGVDWGVGMAGKLLTAAAATTMPTWSQFTAAVWIGISAVIRQAAAVPSAPTNPAAVALTSTSIRITWDDVADETGYRVERSPDGLGSWADVSGNLAAGTVSYDDTGLTASTQYFYRVIAFNAVGDSSPSSTVNATTSAASGNRMGGTGAIRKPPR